MIVLREIVEERGPDFVDATHECDLRNTCGEEPVAAARTGRVGVGYDLDPDYVELAQRRLAAEHERSARIASVTASVSEQPELELQLQLIETLTHDERQDHFQARAVQDGKKAQDIAQALLERSGMIVEDKARVPQAGIQFNFKVASQDSGGHWFVDVSGAFTTSRPGLLRTDTLWKMLGRLHVLQSVSLEDPPLGVLVLTSNQPRPGSEGDKALRAVGPRGVFDVIELHDPKGEERLRAYAAGCTVPLDGFWKPEEIAAAGMGD